MWNQPGTPPVVVAHAGGRGEAPPNTLEAFRAALEQGADMLECDIHRTADGRLVLHHDDTVGGIRLAAAPYEAVAQALGPAHRIPELRDLLQLGVGRVAFDLELKVEGLERDVAAAVQASGVDWPDALVTSFLPAAVQAMSRLEPRLRTGLLVHDLRPAEALTRFAACGADFLGPDVALLDDRGLAAYRLSGVPLLPWTVNDEATMRRLLAEPSVFGLITDDVATARRIFETAPPRLT